MKTILAATAMAVVAAGCAHAGNSYRYAPVVDVEPRYAVERTPVDREICRDVTAYERERGHHDSKTPTVVGAIIGGVIGNQFGSGNGRRAATVAGAALGGSIGRDAGRSDDRYHRTTRTRCHVERDWQEREVVTDYRVTYEYDGKLYRTVTREHPGDHVRVRVDVTPVH